MLLLRPAAFQILKNFRGYTTNPLCRSTPQAPTFSHARSALHAVRPSTSVPILPTLRNDHWWPVVGFIFPLFFLPAPFPVPHFSFPQITHCLYPWYVWGLGERCKIEWNEWLPYLANYFSSVGRARNGAFCHIYCTCVERRRNISSLPALPPAAIFWHTHLDAIQDIVSVILDIHKTVKIIFVCLTAAARVIFNWRLTNVLTNYRVIKQSSRPWPLQLLLLNSQTEDSRQVETAGCRRYSLKHDFVDGKPCFKYSRRQNAASQYILVQQTVNSTVLMSLNPTDGTLLLCISVYAVPADVLTHAVDLRKTAPR